ncbi:MAG: FMN-binding negative transcriptional regulator [Solirubrobacteraceae bacterium]|nr:FMN-binding negative transcriptional regulator [Patulibacter sp.]
MRHNPLFEVTDEAVVRALIAANPWTTIVSSTAEGPVASHYPVLLDDTAEALTVVTHVGRPDDRIHGFGSSEILMIFAGPHGYISPSWYAPADEAIPTWNFSTAHCYGVPEVLGDDENVAVLSRLTDHFEDRMPDRRELSPEVARQVARGTVGIRVPITRFVCKVKMSQNKDPETRRRVIDALEREGEPYADPILAAEMRAALGFPPR